MIDYFDASLIGLTATPDNRTYGFFKKNVVSDYSHEKAVADGVNVGNEIYTIETEITKQGAQINAHQPGHGFAASAIHRASCADSSELTV